MNRRIKAFYFSATGTTKKIVSRICAGLMDGSGASKIEEMDFTLPDGRGKPVSFTQEDLVVVGLPVYAGRVPNVLLKYLNTVTGNGATAVAVAVYGNRHYDDALIELKDLLGCKGLNVIAAGAFIGEHSFSKILGRNRPDEQDLSAAAEFANRIRWKIASPGMPEALSVPGQQPYRPYYQPRDKDGNPVSILKVAPKTSDDCIHCQRCAELCPMGSIDADDVAKITGICIKCCACVKQCPVGAKYFDDAGYLRHKSELENAYASVRREPEFFL